jgi:predicted ThiF/HesA family dinucleotide-utilizing enzyme
MAIKKAFQPIMDILLANPKATIASVLDQVTALASAAGGVRAEGNVFLKDDKGATVAIYDYYFKRWMPLVGEKKVEFGAKVGTVTGFNSMSKEGVSEWTKQQRLAKTAGAELLQNVAAGKVKPDQILAEQAKIEEARKAIKPTTLGFATLEEVKAYLVKTGVKVVDAPLAVKESKAA